MPTYPKKKKEENKAKITWGIWGVCDGRNIEGWDAGWYGEGCDVGWYGAGCDVGWYGAGTPYSLPYEDPTGCW